MGEQAGQRRGPGVGDVSGGAVDGGWGDLVAATSRTCFPLRNSELLSMHMRHRVVVRCLARPGFFCMCLWCPPHAQGKGAGGAGQGDEGSWAPCPALAQLTFPSVTGSGGLGCRIPTAGSAQPW